MQPLVNNTYLLEKHPGKGGWTYARIHEIPQDSNSPFGWVKVKGSIDGYEIKKYHLMPMGNGQLFLPVKAEIRKKIGKKEGDKVHVILYPDTDELEIPAELLMCLQDEPSALKFFNAISESERKYYVNWIYGAKKEPTRINRLAKAINRLSQGLKMYDTDARE
jgi:bifunctional DNA-binding transcriptional regulator/antitoxin component of YhaV-PrlF toxin-antitoxin module